MKIIFVIIIMGVVINMGVLVKQLKERFKLEEKINGLAELHKANYEHTKENFDNVNKNFDYIQKSFDNGFDDFKGRFGNVNEKVRIANKGIDEIKDNIKQNSSLKLEVKDINHQLEKEIINLNHKIKELEEEKKLLKKQLSKEEYER